MANTGLRCVEDGIVPDDETLQRRMEAMRVQRKSASKDDESLIERESLGFFQPV